MVISEAHTVVRMKDSRSRFNTKGCYLSSNFNEEVIDMRRAELFL